MRDRQKLKEELGLSRNVKLVFNFGKLGPEKGLTFAADAVEQTVKNRFPDVFFLAVGPGSD